MYDNTKYISFHILVFKLIMQSDRREDAWHVFLTMLLGYQHSPDAFHLIVPDVIKVLFVVAHDVGYEDGIYYYCFVCFTTLVYTKSRK